MSTPPPGGIDRLVRFGAHAGFVSTAESVLPGIRTALGKTGAVCRHQMDMRTRQTGAAVANWESPESLGLDPVIRWRIQRLVAAGVQSALAGRVARAPDFDIHAVLDLLDRGCPVELAVRIIDPSDLAAEAS